MTVNAKVRIYNGGIECIVTATILAIK